MTAAWLDPALQASIQQGSDAASRLLIADVQQKVQALGGEVARLTSLAEGQQRLLDKFTVSDSDRGRTLQGFETRFTGVENLRTQVTTFSSQIDALNKNVGTVLELRNSLSDASGTPINVTKLRDDVAGLQQLSENLNGADGKPVRIVDLELKVRDLSDAVGVGSAGGLDARLTAAVGGLEDRLNKRVDDRSKAVQEQITAAQTQTLAKVDAETKASVAAALANVDSTIAAKVGEAEAGLKSTLGQTITTSIQTATDQITASTNNLINQRFAALPDQIKSTVAGAQAASEATLLSKLSVQVSSSVDTRAAAAEARTTAQVKDLATKQDAFQEQLQNDIQDAINGKIEAVQTDLTNKFTAQAAQSQQALSTQVSTQIADAMKTATASVNTQINDGLNQRLADLDTRVNSAVTAGLSTLPDQVKTEVGLEVAALDVTGELAAANTQITTQFRSELNQAIAGQQLRTTNTINALTVQLRGETAATVKAGIDSVFQRTSDLVAGVRADVTSVSDRLSTEVTRFGGSGTRINTTLGGGSSAPWLISYAGRNRAKTNVSGR